MSATKYSILGVELGFEREVDVTRVQFSFSIWDVFTGLGGAVRSNLSLIRVGLDKITAPLLDSIVVSLFTEKESSNSFYQH